MRMLKRFKKETIIGFFEVRYYLYNGTSVLRSGYVAFQTFLIDKIFFCATMRLLQKVSSKYLEAKLILAADNKCYVCKNKNVININKNVKFDLFS